MFRTVFKHPWPGSDADHFMSRTLYIELSTRIFRRLNQLGTPYFNLERLSRSLCLARREFRLWSDFGTALIQTLNFSCTEPNA